MVKVKPLPPSTIKIKHLSLGVAPIPPEKKPAISRHILSTIHIQLERSKKRNLEFTYSTGPVCYMSPDYYNLYVKETRALSGILEGANILNLQEIDDKLTAYQSLSSPLSYHRGFRHLKFLISLTCAYANYGLESRGAIKFQEYLSQLLRENFGLPDDLKPTKPMPIITIFHWGNKKEPQELLMRGRRGQPLDIQMIYQIQQIIRDKLLSKRYLVGIDLNFPHLFELLNLLEGLTLKIERVRSLQIGRDLSLGLNLNMGRQMIYSSPKYIYDVGAKLDSPKIRHHIDDEQLFVVYQNIIESFHLFLLEMPFALGNLNGWQRLCTQFSKNKLAVVLGYSPEIDFNQHLEIGAGNALLFSLAEFSTLTEFLGIFSQAYKNKWQTIFSIHPWFFSLKSQESFIFLFSYLKFPYHLANALSQEKDGDLPNLNEKYGAYNKLLINCF